MGSFQRDINYLWGTQDSGRTAGTTCDRRKDGSADRRKLQEMVVVEKTGETAYTTTGEGFFRFVPMLKGTVE